MNVLNLFNCCIHISVSLFICIFFFCFVSCRATPNICPSDAIIARVCSSTRGHAIVTSNCILATDGIVVHIAKPHSPEGKCQTILIYGRLYAHRSGVMRHTHNNKIDDDDLSVPVHLNPVIVRCWRSTFNRSNVIEWQSEDLFRFYTFSMNQIMNWYCCIVQSFVRCSCSDRMGWCDNNNDVDYHNDRVRVSTNHRAGWRDHELATDCYMTNVWRWRHTHTHTLSIRANK